MTEMSAEELLSALEPVRRYHRPGEVTATTVLAAYLRAAQLKPEGRTWEAARKEFRSSGDFSRAVDAVLLSKIDGSSSHRDGPTAGSVAPAVTPATPLTGGRSSRAPLDWYPQKFEPGAIQGAGAKKLLGTPHVSTEELLVRETAQNSWDARSGERPVEFIMNLRDLQEATVTLLRESVFTGSASGTRIAEALQAPDLRAIEITDRGTIGLGGPVRNDHAIVQGSVTHFIDLIFNIGATKSDLTSGGTYGFGKSIAYMVSEVGAILVWSRCATDQGPEDRLIASAIGDVFEMDGYRYTGRHWWGRTVESRPEPVIGAPASELGRQIFAKPFADDELGTSILILAPELGAPGPEDDALTLTQAVLANLWPKLLPDESGMKPMDIRIQVNEVDHPIPDPTHHPVLSGPVSCLRAVQAVQAGRPVEPTLFPVEVIDIKRYSEVLGHLALTKYPVSVAAGSEATPSRAVVLMRNGAELVVREIERSPLTEPGFQWAGVFKPVAALDPTFARSEPPAHDDWSPASLPDKIQRSQVKLAIQRIQEAADRFVEPYAAAPPAQSSTSAAAVGDMLAGLMAGSIGSAPTRASSTGMSAGGSRSTKASVRVGPAQWSDGERSGWTRTHVTIEVIGGPPAGSDVQVDVRIGTDGGTERTIDPDFLRDGGWTDGGGSGTARILPGASLDYWFESSDDVAIDMNARIVAGGTDE
ncbi:hypothetical protein [Nocardioides campestrisoli]|uniref:hypothetical protein n=1 Tax=Nocardioides campestrisoli TaxID=2736757 RepID=UPI0015E79154|nr:hypothetical protein [Nocardioides campestrisoli]